ncbi:hypothetical protein AMECASPLE_038844, partial [Ameca splendens]
MPCHNKLVEPSLTTNQSLTGDLLKKLFHQKSIYVRPDKVIVTEEKESSCSEEDTRDAKSCDLEEVFDSDKLICNIPKEAASSIPTVEGQFLSCDIPSISTGDDVVWCVATQDICTGALSSDTPTMSTSATVITIDDNLSLSGRTSVTTSGHSQAPSSCCLISADNDRLSAVSN